MNKLPNGFKDVEEERSLNEYETQNIFLDYINKLTYHSFKKEDNDFYSTQIQVYSFATPFMWLSDDIVVAGNYQNMSNVIMLVKAVNTFNNENEKSFCVLNHGDPIDCGYDHHSKGSQVILTVFTTEPSDKLLWQLTSVFPRILFSYRGEQCNFHDLFTNSLDHRARTK